MSATLGPANSKVLRPMGLQLVKQQRLQESCLCPRSIQPANNRVLRPMGLQLVTMQRLRKHSQQVTSATKPTKKYNVETFDKQMYA